MSRAIKCDRCGKLCEAPTFVPDIRVKKCMHLFDDYYYDLCPECQQKLENFLEGKEELL